MYRENEKRLRPYDRHLIKNQFTLSKREQVTAVSVKIQHNKLTNKYKKLIILLELGLLLTIITITSTMDL